MDAMKEFMEHIWQIIVLSLSAAISLIMFRHKKNIDRQETMQTAIQQHSTTLEVLEERIKHVVDDLEDIKDDLKQILYKLVNRSRSK